MNLLNQLLDVAVTIEKFGSPGDLRLHFFF